MFNYTHIRSQGYHKTTAHRRDSDHFTASLILFLPNPRGIFTFNAHVDLHSSTSHCVLTGKQQISCVVEKVADRPQGRRPKHP